MTWSLGVDQEWNGLPEIILHRREDSSSITARGVECKPIKSFDCLTYWVPPSHALVKLSKNDTTRCFNNVFTTNYLTGPMQSMWRPDTPRLQYTTF